MNNQIIAVNDIEFDELSQITAENVLAPGYYWRLKNDFQVENPRWKDHPHQLHAGDVHLLLDIFEHEGSPHTAIVLSHPRDGANTEYRILIADFLTNFEPEKDADAVRAKEQAQIMGEVQTMQEEMAQAQINPMALPGMKDAVDEAVEKFERSMVAEVAASQKDQMTRTADLRKIHRRAARRSEAAGNPLTVRSVVVSDQVGHLISGGINSEGLQDLTVEAKRRITVAEATAKWLTKRANEMGDILKSLTPYYAEKGKVALARANKAITYVKDITQGLTSLTLYTGDGVEVIPVTEGVSAPAVEPLTLVQGKRYMDEELAVWADVDDSFDWKSQSRFFDALKENASLVNQIFPTPRCVVSVAVTRRNVEYSDKTSPRDRALSEIRNRSVFLLVRDGKNIHSVYSSEPSHECTSRLFPTQDEIEKPFRGIDGTKIGLQDVSFGTSVERFNNVSLHYKRFLILLCGLDHRLKLFGEFYPPENALEFMSLEFQQKYFHFHEDDNVSRLIGDSLESVNDWINRCNKAVRSGSRVVISSGAGLTGASPQLRRLHSMRLNMRQLPSQLIVTRAKGHHYVTVPISSDCRDEKGTANAWLDGPDAAKNQDWFLCMDMVRLEVVRRYIYSRINRIGIISWLRTFKRVEAILVSEHAQQAGLRSALAKAAVENAVLTPVEVGEAVESALATWRASRRGADAPFADDIKSVNELLTLMYPSDRIAQSTDQWVAELIRVQDAKPLMLCRTGSNRLVLYVQATDRDKEPYAKGVHWGWVKRILIDVLKTKLSVASTSLVWLEKGKPNAAEIVIREWPELAAQIHAYPQPCQLKWLEVIKTKIATTEKLLANVLELGRGKPCNAGIHEDFMMPLTWNAERVFSELKHFEHIRMAIPVGVIQHTPDSPVLFLYAMTRAANFVNHYGTEKQWEAYKAEVFTKHVRFHQKSLEHGLAWTLIQTKEPFKNTVLETNAEWKVPGATKIQSHKSGGYTKKQLNNNFFSSNKSTRAERRAKGGNAGHESVEFRLSWNRSIESILGVAPHLRRNFHKDQRNNFYWTNANKTYEPAKIARELSLLIWNEKQDRSIANRYFSTGRSSD